MPTTLLIDVSYLGWRAFHSTGGLSFHGEPTGVLFGILRDIENLVETFGASRCVMAFDYGGGGLRGQLFPDYKIKRRTADTPEKELAKEELYIQIARLRSKVLPDLGYRNVFRAKGYEADDVLALCAERMTREDDAIIVTGDEDLWQCLRSNVSWYSPKTRKTVTEQSFRSEWGIDPVMWADVKAFAGCGTDDVPGLDGVGPKTAAKWFRGELKQDSKGYQAISAGLDVYNRNIKLVRLPFPGLELPDIRDDEVTEAKRVQVQVSLGIRAGRRAVPVMKGFDL